MFPRLQKRGPIEAPSTRLCRVQLTSFNAYKSVAPLKRHRDRRRRPVRGGFHAYKSVAPLKPQHAGLGDGLLLRFHAYKSVAPLKHQREDQRPINLRVSTLTKAWPH